MNSIPQRSIHIRHIRVTDIYKNIAPYLPPTEEYGKVARDYEYERMGTLFLLAGLDLLTGESIPLVSDTHKSSDFIEWLILLNRGIWSMTPCALCWIAIPHILRKKPRGILQQNRDALNLYLPLNMVLG